MKKTILITSLTLLLATAPAIGQMMGGGQMMGSGQDAKSTQQMYGNQDARSNQQMVEQQRNDSAQEVLEKRFAKGEISQEEFENAMEVLRRNKE